MEEMLARLDGKKARLDAARPLPPGVVAKLKEYFDVEWTYHSNAIEGSTLTLAETRLVLLDGLTVGGKSLREHLEAINHKHAIDFVEALAAKAALEDAGVNACAHNRDYPCSTGGYCRSIFDARDGGLVELNWGYALAPCGEGGPGSLPPGAHPSLH